MNPQGLVTTNFEDALCQKNGLLDYSWKKKECIQLQGVDDVRDACDEVERMLIHIDEQSPNCLQDNILYYIGGYIVRRLLQKLQCENAKKNYC